MKIKSLKDYLLTISKEGYATNDEKEWKKESDGSTTIANNHGSWNMNDNFYGGEPYGGREIVFFEGKPHWIMVYYGQVSKKVNDVGKIYAFLQKALANTDIDFPLRGPKELDEGDLKYENNWSGTISEFNGHEKILLNGDEVYSASYLGGLVDQRGEQL